MGLKVTVRDGDKVEEVNVGGQLYKTSDSGKSKVLALSEHSDREIGINRNFVRKPQNLNCEILVSAVDKNYVREYLYSSFINFTPGARLFIDGRIGGLVWKVLAVDRREPEWYVHHLHSDLESMDDPCAKGPTVDVGLMVSARIGMTVRNFLTGNSVARYTIGDMLTGMVKEIACSS
jgi:hypothetical protein